MKHLAIIGVSALVLALAGCGKAPESKPEEIRLKYRFIDLALIDAAGNIDVIEIKKPFDDA